MEDTRNNSQPVGMPEGPMPEMPVVSTAPTLTPAPSANPMGADIMRPATLPQTPIEEPINNFPVESATQPATDFSINPESPAAMTPSDSSAPAADMSPMNAITPKAPKKKSKALVLVVVLVALVLAAAAVFLYLNSTNDTTTKVTVTSPVAVITPATSADVTKLSTDLDASIAIADATQDITSNDLTNTALGL